MKQNVTYIDDLAKELAEEHGLEYNEALEICKLSVEHAYDLMKDPEIITIRFPNLGNLCFNWIRAKYSYRRDGGYKHWVDLLDTQVGTVEKLYKEHKDLAHRRKGFLTIFKKFFFKDKNIRKTIPKSEILRLIEQRQNGLNN